MRFEISALAVVFFCGGAVAASPAELPNLDIDLDPATKISLEGAGSEPVLARIEGVRRRNQIEEHGCLYIEGRRTSPDSLVFQIPRMHVGPLVGGDLVRLTKIGLRGQGIDSERRISVRVLPFTTGDSDHLHRWRLRPEGPQDFTDFDPATDGDLDIGATAILAGRTWIMDPVRAQQYIDYGERTLRTVLKKMTHRDAPNRRYILPGLSTLSVFKPNPDWARWPSALRERYAGERFALAAYVPAGPQLVGLNVSYLHPGAFRLSGRLSAVERNSIIRGTVHQLALLAEASRYPMEWRGRSMLASLPANWLLMGTIPEREAFLEHPFFPGETGFNCCAMPPFRAYRPDAVRGYHRVASMLRETILTPDHALVAAWLAGLQKAVQQFPGEPARWYVPRALDYRSDHWDRPQEYPHYVQALSLEFLDAVASLRPLSGAQALACRRLKKSLLWSLRKEDAIDGGSYYNAAWTMIASLGILEARTTDRTLRGGWQLPEKPRYTPRTADPCGWTNDELSALDRAVRRLWAKWKASKLVVPAAVGLSAPEGTNVASLNLVDNSEEMHSARSTFFATSESQSYALLLSFRMNEPDVFHRVFEATQAFFLRSRAVAASRGVVTTLKRPVATDTSKSYFDEDFLKYGSSIDLLGGPQRWKVVMHQEKVGGQEDAQVILRFPAKPEKTDLRAFLPIWSRQWCTASAAPYRSIRLRGRCSVPVDLALTLDYPRDKATFGKSDPRRLVGSCGKTQECTFRCRPEGNTECIPLGTAEPVHSLHISLPYDRESPAFDLALTTAILSNTGCPE